MKEVNLDNYKFKKIVYVETEEQRKQNQLSDELIQHLQTIIMDRSIDERNKVSARKQLDEVLKIRSMNMPVPKVVYERKEETK